MTKTQHNMKRQRTPKDTLSSFFCWASPGPPVYPEG